MEKSAEGQDATEESNVSTDTILPILFSPPPHSSGSSHESMLESRLSVFIALILFVHSALSTHNYIPPDTTQVYQAASLHSDGLQPILMTPPATNDHQRPSGREIFEASLSGAQNRPFIPPLKSDPPPFQPLPHNLVEFRRREAAEDRERRLRQLWMKLPKRTHQGHGEDDEEVAKEYPVRSDSSLTLESATKLKEMYEDELLGRCGGHTSGFTRRHIGWKEFQKYAEAKEAGVHVFRISFWSTIESPCNFV